jgi:hypothetical protein
MKIKLVKHVTSMREMRNAHEILVGNPEGIRPLLKPLYRWKVN